MSQFTINQQRDIIRKATDRAGKYQESAKKFLSMAIITLGSYSSLLTDMPTKHKIIYQKGLIMNLFLTIKNNQMAFKHLMGYLLVTGGMAPGPFLFHFLFYEKSIPPLYLLYLGMGALVSFILGLFILPKKRINLILHPFFFLQP